MKNYYIHVQGQEVSQDIFSLSDLKKLTKNSILNIKKEGYVELCFVGFIETEKSFLISLPYSIPYTNFKSQPLNKEIKSISKDTVRTIMKYSRVNNNISADLDIKGKIGYYIELLEDFLSYGVISKLEKTYGINGSGAINWSKTFNKHFPKIQSNGIPLFDEFEKRNKLQNKEDLFTKIHLWAIKKSQEYVQFIFDEYDFDLELNETEDFSSDFVRSIITEKMPNLTNDREKRIAELIYYLVTDADEEYYGCIICKRFEYIWEDILRVVCAHDPKLKKFMPSASWNDNNIMVSYLGVSQSKYSPKPPPDVLFLHENNFFVIDAKYYDLVNKYGRPGLTDLWKQIFYCEALKEVFSDSQINFYNALLFPVYKKEKEFLIKKFSNIIFETETQTIKNFSHLSAYALNLATCMKSYLKSESLHKIISIEIINNQDNSQAAATKLS